jgi:hypothetical protein
MLGCNEGLAMTNRNERIDRIERILEQVARSLQEVAAPSGMTRR